MYEEIEVQGHLLICNGLNEWLKIVLDLFSFKIRLCVLKYLCELQNYQYIVKLVFILWVV